MVLPVSLWLRSIESTFFSFSSIKKIAEVIQIRILALFLAAEKFSQTLKLLIE
jgi:hypothetical protein